MDTRPQALTEAASRSGRRFPAAVMLLLGGLLGTAPFVRAAAPARGAEQTATVTEGHGAVEQAIFAAGCFWGVESLFRQVKGVVNVTVGYTGGTVPNPTYEQVCSHKTGHAEAALVEYDPAQVSYEQLLEVFWNNHNPTTPNRQGPDRGSQYRSAVFYRTPAQRAAAKAMKDRLEQSHRFDAPIVTEIVPATEFYRAEESHQRYFEKNGGGQCHTNLGGGPLKQ